MPIEHDISEWTTVIGAQDLINLFDDVTLIVVDCRFSLADLNEGRVAFEAGHIPGARYAHLDDDLSGKIVPGMTGRHPLPDPEIMTETIGRWGISNASQVVVYDSAGGAIAARLWWILNWLGHERVAVLDGGWQQWLKKGYPTTSHVSTYETTQFSGRPDPSLVMTAIQMLEILDDDSWNVIDARAAVRYRGEEEPLDPVAGHIPGALSFPFKENIGDDGLFLLKERLEDRFAPITQAVISSNDASRVVNYCGSGVTGAHNILAMKHSGMAMPRLYAGSWSEWITDPSRPVATGEE